MPGGAGARYLATDEGVESAGGGLFDHPALPTAPGDPLYPGAGPTISGTTSLSLTSAQTVGDSARANSPPTSGHRLQRRPAGQSEAELPVVTQPGCASSGRW